MSVDILTIRNRAGALVVGIKADGGVYYGEGVEVDEAARQFWAAVETVIRATPSYSRIEFPGAVVRV